MTRLQPGGVYSRTNRRPPHIRSISASPPIEAIGRDSEDSEVTRILNRWGKRARIGNLLRWKEDSTRCRWRCLRAESSVQDDPTVIKKGIYTVKCYPLPLRLVGSGVRAKNLSVSYSGFEKDKLWDLDRSINGSERLMSLYNLCQFRCDNGCWLASHLEPTSQNQSERLRKGTCPLTSEL
jgi:hypothetical protein